MHRPTTTATLLVTVAVSALTGCVTTQNPPALPPVPSQPSEPRPDGTTETQIVQAPAREALELIGPPRRPTPSASVAPEPPTSRPTAVPPTPTAPPPRAERPAPPKQHKPPKTQPRVELPRVPHGSKGIPTEPPKSEHVCALGHKYGGWGKDTPQAVICKDVYGP